RIGDYILYDTHCCTAARLPQRGDVVVFRYPGDPSISYAKRVVGIGGDRLEICQGKLTVNGEPVAESYLAGRNPALNQTIVPQGELYVLGDNRERSSDSRVWGTVKAGSVRGRVTCVLYSPSRKQFALPVANPWPPQLARP